MRLFVRRSVPVSPRRCFNAAVRRGFDNMQIGLTLLRLKRLEKPARPKRRRSSGSRRPRSPQQ